MLYDRVLRSELMESNRWLDLHADTSRLAWICLVPLADDFGNFEGDYRRLWRWLSPRTALKTEADVVKVLSELCDADLLRRYEVAGAPYFHIPRFECDRDYITRHCPPSQWDEMDSPGLEARMVNIKGRRKKRWQADAKARAIDSPGKSENARRPVAGSSAVVQPSFRTGVGELPTNATTVPVVENQSHSLSQVDPSAIVQRATSPNTDDTVRGSRLPKAWSLPDDWLSWSLAFASEQARQVTAADVAQVADRFRDYWTAKPGAAGRKADWLATWRNWWRTELTEGRLSRSVASSSAAAAIRRAT
jgi:hypothetical protein